uniref:Uncharacterized protein n=1 Tax=Anguilla anguilla TaxID=7936 RepID=A0A0E9QCJ7_ANGAN
MHRCEVFMRLSKGGSCGRVIICF